MLYVLELQTFFAEHILGTYRILIRERENWIKKKIINDKEGLNESFQNNWVSYSSEMEGELKEIGRIEDSEKEFRQDKNNLNDFTFISKLRTKLFAIKVCVEAGLWRKWKEWRI